MKNTTGTRRVKAWAVIVGGKYPIYAGIHKEAAQAAELACMMKSPTLGTELVPCTIEWSLPTKKSKSGKNKTTH